MESHEISKNPIPFAARPAVTSSKATSSPNAIKARKFTPEELAANRIGVERMKKQRDEDQKKVNEEYAKMSDSEKKEYKISRTILEKRMSDIPLSPQEQRWQMNKYIEGVRREAKEEIELKEKSNQVPNPEEKEPSTVQSTRSSRDVPLTEETPLLADETKAKAVEVKKAKVETTKAKVKKVQTKLNLTDNII